MLSANANANALAAPTERELASELERWFARRALARPRPDPTLALVARAWSATLGEGASGADASDHLDFLLERHAVRDAVVAAVAIPCRDRGELRGRLHAFLEERAAAASHTHAGLALQPRSDGGALATLVLVRRRLEVSGIRAIVGQSLELCATLRSGVRPQVFATAPDGTILERSARARVGERFCVQLGRARRGRYQLELMVEGHYGPEVAALFPLHVGVAPPALPVRKLYPASAPAGREEVEARLLALVNRARREAGVPPLRGCPALARVARRHAGDMLARGFFGHRSPAGGGLRARLAVEAIDYLHAGENLAVASSPERAHDALMASPSHRKNLLDRRYTHLGVGAARSSRGLLQLAACFATLATEE
jgi:uncharacterized protein YkwD